jgi:RNA polymerase sigma-32 factor
MNKEIPFTAKTIGDIIANIKQKRRPPQIFELPLLREETERRLFRMWQNGNQRAGMLLIGAHLKLVLKRIRQCGVSHRSWMFEPLFHTGIEGLNKTLVLFDPSRDLRFGTYAIWWVRSTIASEFLSLATPVSGMQSSGPRHAYPHLKRWKREHGIELNEPIPDDLLELARKYCEKHVKNIAITKQSIQTVDHFLCGRMKCSSLDQSISSNDSGGTTFQDLLPSYAPRPDELVEEKIDGQKRHDLLYTIMKKVLNDKELRIITKRRLTEPAVILENLGRELGICKERVRQLENRAIEKLKMAMQEQMCPDDITDNPSPIDLDRVVSAVKKLKRSKERMVLQDYHLVRKTERPTRIALSNKYNMSLSSIRRLINSASRSLTSVLPSFDQDAFDKALTARELSA